jgi:hypothetical protein
MKTKLTLLAAVILAGVGTSIALDTATPATDKPAGMSCHSDAPAAKDAAPVKAKGCCK